MLPIAIPGRRPLEILHLVLDVNGTIAVDGKLIDGVAARVEQLSGMLAVHLITAGTHGDPSELARTLSTTVKMIKPGASEPHQKADYVRSLKSESVIAVGNGSNDVRMLKAAALGIAVMGREGVAIETLLAANIVVQSPLDGLDLILNPRRLVASLRS